ncbi:16S rRNA (cytidine(1402)-2'-O)-methyltransferase [Patescibacteria group bacterium]|nr:16S rRNA (cytidine(1402)-2'-O)-methyltransferase [Patescibacteria group bacterium]MBU0963906.1 16S rRNA (cytidine(1402)-2'-O)-methyltransferase [Patescibacteria group bacterium]
MTGTLYIVATPIGNLEDITLRALRVLKEADFVVCEDTRHSLKLLNRYEIKKPLISYHQHSKIQKVNHIISLLKEGKQIALVSDAGTPGISDPGGLLVHEVLKTLDDKIKIIPIPGPSALATFISVVGLPTDKFLWLGFLPHKKGRQTLFAQISESKITTIFYESVHRIEKTLNSLIEVLDDNRQIVIGRELTKKFETIYRGSAKDVLEKLKTDEIKGEFVVAVAGK